MTTAKTIKLRYFDLDLNAALLTQAVEPAKSHQAKLDALKVLGIEPIGEEKPGDAWLRTMCAENRLPYEVPVPPEIADAIISERAVYRFYFWLA